MEISRMPFQAGCASDFTKCFGGGFGLTLPLFGRRLLTPREKIAAAAAPSQGAHSARTQGVVRHSRFAIDPVETGFQGSRNVARDAIFESRQAKPRLQEVPFMEETPPENKPGFA